MPSKALLLVLVATLLTGATLSSQQAYRTGTFGLGLIAGDPSGVTGKIWLDENISVNMAAGAGVFRRNSVQFQVDYVWNSFALIDSSEIEGQFAVYFGPGLRALFRNQEGTRDRFGIRFPVGLSYYPTPKWEFFAEAVPVLDLSPKVEGDMNASIGIRYFFD